MDRKRSKEQPESLKTQTAEEGELTEPEAGWAEKAKEDWAKFRAACEAEEKTPEDIAFMDYAEETYAGMPDSRLIEEARGIWHVNYFHGCISTRDLYDDIATRVVLKSRGYDVDELQDKWYAETVACIEARVDAMISEGEPLAGIVRALVARVTNKETGEVDWAGVAQGLWRIPDFDSIDDATLARHGFSRGKGYWAQREVAAVIGGRDTFVAGRVIDLAAKTIEERMGGPMVDWLCVLRELWALGYWDNMQSLRDSEFEQQRALAAYLDEEGAKMPQERETIGEEQRDTGRF